MDYDNELWTQYSKENEDHLQQNLSQLIANSAILLNAKKICEIGCNVGNNLVNFDSSFNVTGVDLNDYALERARKEFPTFKFFKSHINKLPFTDNEYDFVFTRGVLIHIHEEDIPKAISELYRISSKWIMNIEYYGKEGQMIPWKRGHGLLWYRDMRKLWEDYDIEIISEADLPKSVDSDKTRLTLARKNNINHDLG